MAVATPLAGAPTPFVRDDGVNSLKDLFSWSGFTPEATDPNKVRPGDDEPPRGGSGRAHFNGFIQWDERNPKLIGIEGLERFDQMYRTSPDVKRNVLAVWSPIQDASWSIEPYGGAEATDDDRLAADLAWWAISAFMKPNLVQHLSEVGPVLIRSGFCAFEQMWTSTKWRGKTVLVPKKLGLRLPRTIWKWYQDSWGEMTGVEQLLPNAASVGIPASELVYYRVQAEGDNWAGMSLLRQAYQPWFYLEHFQKLDAIGQERKAVGVPVVYAPDGIDAETKGEVETILANLHVNAVGYVVMPGPKRQSSDGPNIGWDIEIVKFDSGSGETIQASITVAKEQVAGAFLADFLELGHHQVGAKATAQVQDDPFWTATEALGNLTAIPLNELIARIAYLNVPGIQGAPTLQMSMHDSASLSELASYAKTLYEGGFLIPSPALEDYFRERADFPAIEPDVRTKAEEAKLAGQQLAIAGAAEQHPDNARGEPGPAVPKGAGKTPVGGGTKPAMGPAGKLADPTKGAPVDPSTGDPDPEQHADPTMSKNGPPRKMLDTADVPTGVMVALYPAADVAGKIAIPKGEPAAELHVTLAFLGKQDTIKTADLDRLRTVVAGWAASTPPIEGEISGAGLFAAQDTPDGKPVTYASVDCPLLPKYREHLVHLLKHAGFKVSQDHGFTPHITLAYAKRKTDTVTLVPLKFGAATLCVGTNKQTFPLTGAKIVKLDAADSDPLPGEGVKPPPTVAWYEKLLQQGELKEAFDTARDEMEQAATPAAHHAAAAVVNSIVGGINPDLTPPDQLVEALQGELERLYGIGHQTVRTEIALQHAALGTRPVHQLDTATELAVTGVRQFRARQRAKLAAANVMHEIGKVTGRAAIGASVSATDMQMMADKAATIALRAEAMANAAPSINDGRADAASAASEELAGGIVTCCMDPSSCDSCVNNDTGEVLPLEEAQALAPNPECEGGAYCRCMCVYVLTGDPRALGSLVE